VTVRALRPGWRARAAHLARLLGIAVTTWAVVQELRTPREARTWQGRVGGLVPYDFRPPTGARARERLWNPAESQLLVPTVFGVGWTLNTARLVAVLCRLARGPRYRHGLAPDG
jgi:hypothetical protein